MKKYQLTTSCRWRFQAEYSYIRKGVVQLLAPPSNHATHLRENSFYKSGKSFLRVSTTCAQIQFGVLWEKVTTQFCLTY